MKVNEFETVEEYYDKAVEIARQHRYRLGIEQETEIVKIILEAMVKVNLANAIIEASENISKGKE